MLLLSQDLAKGIFFSHQHLLDWNVTSAFQYLMLSPRVFWLR